MNYASLIPYGLQDIWVLGERLLEGRDRVHDRGRVVFIEILYLEREYFHALIHFFMSLPPLPRGREWRRRGEMKQETVKKGGIGITRIFHVYNQCPIALSTW